LASNFAILLEFAGPRSRRFSTSKRIVQKLITVLMNLQLREKNDLYAAQTVFATSISEISFSSKQIICFT